MTFGGILALAIGVAMDATAVAGTLGVAAPRIRVRDAARVGLYFGGFQAAMPALGWALGDKIGPALAALDHWVAFGLLVGIGGKMLWDARAAARAAASPAGPESFGVRRMIGLAVATSIDAFAVGVTLPMIDAPLVPSVVAMGITTGLLSIAGLYAGRRLGAALGRRLDAVGGVILVGLATKILIEHLRGG